MSRLKQHLRDRHNGKWDHFSVYLTAHDEHLKELESLLLRIRLPPGNKQKGKFIASQNLRSDLLRSIKDTDSNRRAMLMGGPVARRRRRSKTKTGRGTVVLDGLVERRVRLKATFKGYEYRAALLKNGHISYDGTHFKTPTAAAKAATKRAMNGWAFWRYRNSEGEWVQLRKMRE